MARKMSDAEKKTLIFWGILGIIIFAGVLLLKFVVKVDFLNPTDYSQEVYELERDRNRFYTVNSALIKFYSFVNADDADSVLNILDESYIRDNALTSDNVLESISTSDQSISFSAKLMCSKDLSDTMTSYLVEGEETGTNTGTFIAQKYYRVVLDQEHFRFSVKPITDEEYRGECDE